MLINPSLGPPGGSGTQAVTDTVQSWRGGPTRLGEVGGRQGTATLSPCSPLKAEGPRGGEVVTAPSILYP